MTIDAAYHTLQQQLTAIYDNSEATNIADWVMEAISGKRRREWMLEEQLLLAEEQQLKLARYTNELLQHRPVQYVLGESYFYGMKLFVDENVLIPRPETEELADWIVKYHNRRPEPLTILDIGTGSGCLALAIKKNIPSAEVHAIDISAGALTVVERNAKDQKLDIRLAQLDILDASAWAQLPQMNIIVSNPPYITLNEKAGILPNVLDYEPHSALFVTNNDPLQFYKAIEQFAAHKMLPGGSVFLELHRDFALETRRYYVEKDWKTDLRNDMQGAPRMLHCQR